MILFTSNTATTKLQLSNVVTDTPIDMVDEDDSSVIQSAIIQGITNTDVFVNKVDDASIQQRIDDVLNDDPANWSNETEEEQKADHEATPARGKEEGDAIATSLFQARQALGDYRKYLKV